MLCTTCKTLKDMESRNQNDVTTITMAAGFYHTLFETASGYLVFHDGMKRFPVAKHNL